MKLGRSWVDWTWIGGSTAVAFTGTMTSAVVASDWFVNSTVSVADAGPNLSGAKSIVSVHVDVGVSVAVSHGPLAEKCAGSVTFEVTVSFASPVFVIVTWSEPVVPISMLSIVMGSGSTVPEVAASAQAGAISEMALTNAAHVATRQLPVIPDPFPATALAAILSG